MRLAIGTAQFGLTYGISNTSGKVRRDDVRQVLELARANGIDTLDTAVAYGDSEATLGAIGTKGFKIVTKLPDFPEEVSDLPAWVRDQIHASLNRLGVDSIYGLLLHHPNKLIGPRGHILAQALELLKANGLVQKIGVSIYNPDELEALTKVLSIDLVQAPFNVIDQRLLTSGWLNRLHGQGIEVHARSVFLQGLLLMRRETIPVKFSPWANIFDLWHAWLEGGCVTATEACLSFAVSQPLIDRVVVGVESCNQLQELLLFASNEQKLQMPDLRCEDENLINPSNWNSL